MEPDYIGDGVYVSYDGYQIWISVNDHRNPPVVALEQSVFEALIRYGNRAFNTRFEDVKRSGTTEFNYNFKDVKE